MENNGTVYCITNKGNGKKYVGATIKGLSHRKYYHYYNSNSARTPEISKILRATSKDDWDWSILEEGVSVNDLKFRETFWIIKLDCVENGYNKNYGGASAVKIKKPMRFWHPAHGEFMGLIDDCMKKLGCGKTTIYGLNGGSIKDVKGWVNIKNKGYIREVKNKVKESKERILIKPRQIFKAYKNDHLICIGTTMSIAPIVGVSGNTIRRDIDTFKKNRLKLSDWRFELFDLVGMIELRKGGKYHKVIVI